MLIDKPQCNFKNCRYCFDGNCMSADKYENCKLTDLHYEIAKLTVDLDNAKGKWISVDERLPEEFETVLVFCDTGTSKFYCVSEMIEPNGERWSAVCGFRVTHWMPLPEPPKGE